MRQVINRKVYDTETDTEIANYWNYLPTENFRYLDETLYQTKKGQFFTVGNGGPRTKYAEILNNAATSESQLIPLDNDEAYDFLERHNFTDEIEKYFLMELRTHKK